MNMAQWAAQQFINCFCEGLTEYMNLTGTMPTEIINDTHDFVIMPDPETGEVCFSVHTHAHIPMFRPTTPEEDEAFRGVVDEKEIANPRFN